MPNRSGHPDKPSALRSYEQALRLRVLPEFGATRIADLCRPDLQEFTNGLLSSGLRPSAIKVAAPPASRPAPRRGPWRACDQPLQRA